MVLVVCLKPWLVTKPVPKAFSVLGSIIRLMVLVVAFSPIGFNVSRTNDRKVCPEYKTNVDLVGEIHCIHACDRLYHEFYIVQ